MATIDEMLAEGDASAILPQTVDVTVEIRFPSGRMIRCEESIPLELAGHDVIREALVSASVGATSAVSRDGDD